MKAKLAVVSEAVASEKCERAAQAMSEASGDLYRVALAIGDGYWASVNREADKRDAFFRYGVRVKRRVYGVSIEWMQGVPVGNGETRRMLFRSMPRGRGSSYRRSTFAWAKSWEIAEIMKVEAKFALVRNASDRLAEAGRRMGWVRKRLERGAEIDSKHLRAVLALVEDACDAVTNLTRVDFAAETECVR